MFGEEEDHEDNGGESGWANMGNFGSEASQELPLDFAAPHMKEVVSSSQKGQQQ